MKTYHSRKFVLLICILMIAFSAHASYVEIGTGTGNTSKVPFSGFYDYGWSRTIYLQSEILTSIDISGVSFNVWNTPSNYTIENITIYMKHTSETVFSSADYFAPLDNGYTLCYSGNPTFDGSGWHTITLDTPFEYNGTDNLIILCENNDGDFTSGFPRFYYTLNADRTVYRVQDNSFPMDSGTLSADTPNIRLEYTPSVGAPGEPIDPIPSDGAVNCDVDMDILSWVSGENTTSFDVYFGMNNPPTTLIAENIAGTTTTIPYELEFLTTYYWKVIARNLEGQIPSSVWSFTTENIVISDFPYNTDFVTFPPQYWSLEGGTSNWIHYSSGDVTCASTTYHIWGTGHTAYMTLPEIIVPASPRMTFNWSHAYDASNPNDALTVQVSNNGGDSWTDMWHLESSEFESGDGAGYTTPGDLSTVDIIDLAPYEGQMVTLRFYAFWENGPVAFIDNVSVFSNLSAPDHVDTIEPVDGATEVLISGELQWETTGMASGYYLYFGTDYPPTNIVNGVDQGLNSTYEYSALSLNTNYYWQIVPFNDNGLASDCPVWSFTTMTYPLKSDVVAPLDGEIEVSTAVILEWEAAMGAMGYYLHLGTNNPPTTFIDGADLGNTLTYQCNGLAIETTHYWQIVPYNEFGNTTGYETWSFTTYGYPEATTVIAPADASIDRPVYIDLVWSSVDSAEDYYLCFGTNYSANNILNGFHVGQANFHNIGFLDTATTYYWKIVPHNYAGFADYCPVWSFTTTSVDPNSGTDGTYYFANSLATDNRTSHPTYRWIDTTDHTELTTLNSGTNDDGNWLVTLPFSFPFYGDDKSNLYITTNGLLAFSSNVHYSNNVIPNTDYPNIFIAVMWDDMQYADDAQVFAGGDENSFTITYWHLPTHTSTDYYITAQATLFPDGKIIVCYNRDESVSEPNYYNGYDYDSTMGIENSDGTLGIQYRAGTSSSIAGMSTWVGGPIFDPVNGDLAVAYSLDENDLDWPAGAPDKPANVSVDVDGSSVILSWDAVDGAAGYVIYGSAAPCGTFNLIDTTSTITISLTNTPETFYYFVTATDSVVRPSTTRIVSQEQANDHQVIRSSHSPKKFSE